MGIDIGVLFFVQDRLSPLPSGKGFRLVKLASDNEHCISSMLRLKRINSTCDKSWRYAYGLVSCDETTLISVP